MKIFKYTLAVLISAAFTTGCDKDLEVSDPNRQTIADYWETPEHASEGVIAIYSALIVEGTYMRMLPASTDGRGDDFSGDSPWIVYTQFSNFTMPPVEVANEWPWRDHYQIVFRANQVLDRVPDIEFNDEDLKDRLLGQAYFLRGLAFFNLLTNYERISVITENQYNDGEYFYPEQASQEEAWAQIVSDFQNAKDRLPLSYEDVTGPDQGQIGRATWGAAAGMLGKSYLYQEMWQEAYDEFAEVMNSGQYDLVDDYQRNFLPGPANENNEESLFEIQYSHDIGGTIVNWCCEPVNTWMNVTALGQTYAMTAFGGWGDFKPTQGLYEAFKEEQTVNGDLDPRLFATIASYEPGQSTEVYNSPWPQSLPTTNIYGAKYTYCRVPGFTSEGGGTTTYSAINYRILRYADVLLMAAETLNELGRPGEAAPLIQQVRSRADLPDRTAEFAGMSQEELRDQLAHERYLELAVESIRIHDLRRWGWLDDPAKLEILKERDSDFETYTPGNEYLPIPQRELDANPSLRPNSAN